MSFSRVLPLYIVLSLLVWASPLPLLEGQMDPSVFWETTPSVYSIATKSSTTSISKIRAHRHKNYTRVVLDLSQQVQPAPREHRTATHFQLELPKTRLAAGATTPLATTTFPVDLDISITSAGSALLNIPIEGWRRYKWYVLQKPARLVLDLYPGSPKSPATPKALPKQKAQKPRSAPIPTLPPPKKNKPIVVVIDPGHGGKDPGALGKIGTREKDIVLKIAHHVQDFLKKKTSAKVFMTRDTDVFVELEDRATFANKHKADLFISIHINSHPKSRIKGLELYHFGEASDPRALEVAARENGTPLEDNGPAWQFILADKLHDKKIEDSRELAWTTKKSLVKHLNRFYKIKDHGIKTAPFFVLRMTTMPAILAEVAFISNPTEEKLLNSSKYQKRMAEGIFNGLKAYIKPHQTASK